MRELFVWDKNLASAYHKALLELNKFGEKVTCTDWNTECIEASMTIHIEEPLSEPMISKCFIGGIRELQQYKMEMLDGILDFEVAKGNWEYTYHNRMVDCDGKDQIQYVIEELKRNPDSRRAVIIIRNSSDIGSDDPACMQHLQFFIRNGKLDCIVLFRSNDACKASFMNMFALIMLQKRIADSLGVEVGTYTHKANSYHCYGKDYDMFNGYIERIKNDEESCFFDYKDEWEDAMEDEIPSIMQTVEELKNR